MMSPEPQETVNALGNNPLREVMGREGEIFIKLANAGVFEELPSDHPMNYQWTPEGLIFEAC